MLSSRDNGGRRTPKAQYEGYRGQLVLGEADPEEMGDLKDVRRAGLAFG
ncbi:hypothetical protein [Streptomyces sp. NBC_01217]|nr:hypothetical protein OG507_16890 [Streptomyces sp. NBC_01217]